MASLLNMHYRHLWGVILNNIIFRYLNVKCGVVVDSKKWNWKLTEFCLGGTSSQIDLTSIIQLDKSKSVEMIDGDGDFPTFRFTAGHNQGSPATDVFPEHLYEDFSIVAHIRYLTSSQCNRQNCFDTVALL